WGHVFGNHDEEKGYKACEQEKVYESFPLCVSKAGDPNVHGVGNYVLPVWSSDGSRPVYNVWALDTHRGFSDFIKEYGLDPDPWFYRLGEPMHAHSGYDTVRFDQVSWYYEASELFESEYGGKIPGAMVFHIALPEYTVPYKNPAQTRYRGSMRESIGNGPNNSGLYNAIVERGDVRTLVCGHDHINDWEATYLGVRMTYDAGLSYDGYCDDDLRGGRIIDVDEADPWNVRTYMVRCSDVVEGYQVQS
nr:hypothetical protein [Clostridia bacterium]